MPEQTATNPQTGERVVLRNGQWVPMGQGAPVQQVPQRADPIIRPVEQPAPITPIQEANLGLSQRGQANSESNETFDRRGNLRSEFVGSDAYTNYDTAVRQLAQGLVTAENPSGDQSLIIAYARMLDPTSVVREAEFDITQQADSAMGRTVARLQRELGIEGGGRLSPEARQRVRAEMRNLAVGYRQSYEQQRNDYSDFARRNNIDPFEVVGTDIGAPFNAQFREYDRARGIGGGAGQQADSGGSGGGSGGGGSPVTLRDMYPQGAQLGMDMPEAAVTGEGVLQQLGITPEQERQMVGAFNAAARSRRNSFTTQDARAIFEAAGLPVPADAELAAAVEQVRSGGTFSGYDTRALEADRQAELEAMNAAEGRGDLGYNALAEQGALQGMGDELAGADAFMTAAGNLENPFTAYSNERDATRLALEQARERTGWGGVGAELAGGLLTGGVRAAPAVMRATRPVAAAAREGAILGGAAGFGYGEGPADSIGGAIVGAGTGAAMGAGVQGAAGAIGAARASGVAARQAARSQQSAAGREIVQAGEREGVRVMRSDIDPPTTPIGNLARNTGESIPFAGTGGPRAAQQAERVQAVRNIASEFGVTGSDDFIGAVSADLEATRGRALTNLTNRKDAIIDGIAGPVDAPLAVQAIDDQIARLNGINETQFAPVVRQLQAFRETLASGKSLRQIEGNRRLLGDMFADQSLASIRGDGQKALNAIYGPLREDMANFVAAQAGPQVATRLRKVNERLAAMVGELDATNFRRVLNDTDTTPERVADLLFSRNGSDVRRVVENLSPRGRSAAQSAIIYRAIESAGDIEAVAALGPRMFANAIRKYSGNIGVVFSKDEASRLQGLQRLLRATQRASDVALNPPTGARNAIPVVAAVLGSWLGSAPTAIGTGAIGGLLARVYESPMMRNRLIGLAQSQPGSIRETRTIENIARTISNEAGLRDSILRAVNDNAVGSSRIAAEEQKPQQQ